MENPKTETEKISWEQTESMFSMAAQLINALNGMIERKEYEAVIEYKGRPFFICVIDGFRPYLRIHELEQNKREYPEE